MAPPRRNLKRLYTLTVQPEGPTGRAMEQIAQEIVVLAREKAHKFNPELLNKYPEILQTIEASRRGNEIVIGVRPDKPAGPQNFAQFLVTKEAKEHNWLRPAAEEVMLAHGGLFGFGGKVVARGSGGRFVKILN